MPKSNPLKADVDSQKILSRLEEHWKTYKDKSIDVEVEGHSFQVLPNVYNPNAPISRTMAATVKDVAGKRVLDMGCGAGILGILALHRGAARVTFADVNPAALANTNANVSAHGMTARADVLESDLFSGLGEKRFDRILFNAPFIYSEAPINKAELSDNSSLWSKDAPPPTSFFDVGYSLIDRFFSGAKRHLNEGGWIQFAFSNIGNSEALQRVLDRHGFTREKLHSTQSGEYEWMALAIRPQ